MPRILSLHIFKECSSFFLLTFTIITVTAMLGKIVGAVELATSASLGIMFVVELVASSIPYSISYTIPASFMASIIIVFTRLSTDNELTAIKSSGISLTAMLKPTMALASIVFLASLLSNLYLYPKGNTHIKELMFEAAKTKLTSGIEEKRFYDQFKDSVLYIDRINRGKLSKNEHDMEGIFISKNKEGENPVVIYANYGSLQSDSETLSLELNLFNGVIYKEETLGVESRTHKLTFDTYRIDLSMEQRFFGKTKSYTTKNLTIEGINEMIIYYKARDYDTSKLYMEMYKRLAQPFSIFAFVLLAIPLGIQKVRTPKFTGAATALTLILIFQILNRISKVAGEEASLDPLLAAFAPSVIFMLIGITTFYMALKERQIPIGPFIESAFRKVSKLLWRQKTK